MKKKFAITSKSLQQLMQGIAIKFKVIGLCNKKKKKKFVVIKFRYFNDNIDTMIYLLFNKQFTSLNILQQQVITLRILLQQIANNLPK